MANFIPQILGTAAGQGVETAQQQGPPDGKVPSSRNQAQVGAQQPDTLNAMGQPAQSVGFMDMLSSANMQGQQDLGRVQQQRQSRYPGQPMNDQNSWWSMYR